MPDNDHHHPPETPPRLTPAERLALLTMPDEALLRQCRVDVFRGTGNGGQKRNRTDSAVRLTHLATGAVATCDETRSQHQNRQLALRKLRDQIALVCRCQPPATPPCPQRPGARSADYPAWVGAVLDALDAHDFRLAEAAEQLGTSTGRLVRDLATDTALWQAANAGRARCGHRPLRADA